jgi:hypothetical protein
MSLTTPSSQEETLGAKLLDAVIAPVYNVNRPIRRHRNMGWMTELPHRSPFTTPGSYQKTLGAKLLDAVIPTIGNKY